MTDKTHYTLTVDNIKAGIKAVLNAHGLCKICECPRDVWHEAKKHSFEGYDPYTVFMSVAAPDGQHRTSPGESLHPRKR